MLIHDIFLTDHWLLVLDTFPSLMLVGGSGKKGLFNHVEMLSSRSSTSCRTKISPLEVWNQAIENVTKLEGPTGKSRAAGIGSSTNTLY